MRGCLGALIDFGINMDGTMVLLSVRPLCTLRLPHTAAPSSLLSDTILRPHTLLLCSRLCSIMQNLQAVGFILPRSIKLSHKNQYKRALSGKWISSLFHIGCPVLYISKVSLIT